MQKQNKKLLLLGALGVGATLLLTTQKQALQVPTDNKDFGNKAVPLGIRNSNPGNLRVSSVAWAGKLPADKSGFERFSSLDLGIRASFTNMLTAIKKHKCDTVRKLVYRWAPPSENDSAAYVSAVSKQAIISPDVKINVTDKDTLSRIALAIFNHENGSGPVKTAGIDLNRIMAVVNKYNLV